MITYLTNLIFDLQFYVKLSFRMKSQRDCLRILIRRDIFRTEKALDQDVLVNSYNYRKRKIPKTIVRHQLYCDTKSDPGISYR